MRKNVKVFGRGTEGEKRKKAGLRRPAPPCHRSPEFALEGDDKEGA